MKVDLETLDAAVSLSRTGFWGNIVERELIMRQSWPDILTELRASREVVAAVREFREMCTDHIPCLFDALDKYNEAVK